MTKKRRIRRPGRRAATRPAAFQRAEAPARPLLDRIADEGRIRLSVLTVVGIAALFLRLAELLRPMDYDEAFTFVYFARRPLSEGLSDYSLPNNHLLHTLLVHILFRLFGNHPWLIRLPAFLAGLALVPATYFLVRRLFDRWAALLGAALVACSAPLVDYSTNARGYTMLVLCFVLSFALAARLVRENRRADWILLVALSAAGLYTIPTMIYGFGALVLWLAIEIRTDAQRSTRRVLRRHTLLAVLAVAGLTAAAYSPVWLRSGFGVLTSKGLGSAGTGFGTEIASSLKATWRQWNLTIPAAVSGALALCSVAGVVLHRRISAYRLSPVVPALLWPAFLLLLQRVVPFTRVWLYLIPLYFATAAAGASALLTLLRSKERTRRIVLSCAALLVVFGLGSRVFLASRPQFEESARVDRICDFLAPQLMTGDLVAAHGYWATPVAYYLLRKDIPLQRLSADWTLEVLQVVPRTGSQPARTRSRPPRTFLVIRAGDEPTLESLRQKARAAGATADLTVLRRFGTTTLYEAKLSKPDEAR